ncbi:hypothetical protein SERLA73DRAFT_80042 [Serpula lacrymans var. lacrymans S7.3]|uniref:Uncharacterized protein n=2 Tax=Serpula lacrymans var. lacrymans TaxID=341189 RepID=F8QIH1_SERL3|nr:uncharacterized protein SERLADRAFT_442036 [Serpula lacrymans var. lacrymans S7.9]EGN91896.1 hypothetical protein SERLA73DRAFT_80042 [Serpula lacrymans var. lacrymans S7.3]EGO20695.1 hypothetical protein SERLADRAFT_442036 [Serpula lacrymans var. lacrymans S7.9]
MHETYNQLVYDALNKPPILVMDGRASMDSYHDSDKDDGFDDEDEIKLFLCYGATSGYDSAGGEFDGFQINSDDLGLDNDDAFDEQSSDFSDNNGSSERVVMHDGPPLADSGLEDDRSHV